VFLESQLQPPSEQGPEATYSTIRLESRPTGGEDGVHVYDMFWSDLSGVNGALRVIGELNQLLLHLTSVGVNNVKAGRMEALRHGPKPTATAWQVFDVLQMWAAGTLAWPLVLLNLILAMVSLPVIGCVLLGNLEAGSHRTVAAVLAGFASFGALLAAARYARWWMGPVLPTILGGLWFWGYLAGGPREGPERVLAFLLTLLCLAGAVAVIRWYERHRPGSQTAFTLCLAVVVAAGAVCWARGASGSTDHAALLLLLHLVEGSLWLLAAVWVVFLLLTGAADAAGQWTARVERTAAAARTAFTARLTLVVPATLLLIFIFLCWSMLLSQTLPLFPQVTRDITRQAPLLFEPAFLGNHAPSLVQALSTAALTRSGVFYVAVLLAILAGAGLAMVWAVLPSAILEVIPPGTVAEGRGSARLGEWLTRGYRYAARLAGELICLAIIPGALLYPLIPFPSDPTMLLKSLGGLMGVAGLSLLTFGGRFSKAALGLRPLVRVALDVDNWFREHPAGANPTARIVARYVSLLRHISLWKDQSGHGYGRVVFFAHSQGTVITADLLRYLHLTKTNPLDERELRLLTAGSPLRQLYAQRFPYLYGYGEGPDPAELGLACWHNVYRSGDYVGRYLWQKGFTRDAVQASAVWQRRTGLVGPQKEFCLGAGAHMHYWDLTAPGVATVLDALVIL
jgi:hypothetical protein